MDTQGMSLGKGGTIDPDQVYPPYKPKKMNVITDRLRKELKEIINEVLDERGLYNLQKF
jgi:hypothetical protein